jgi:hypothetical protein
LLDAKWNFRLTEQHLVISKTKNESVRKSAALDVLTNLPFALNISSSIAIESLFNEKEYWATINVYSSNNLEGIDKNFINFFTVSDVN